MTRQFQYQKLAEPVLPQANPAETVTVDKWLCLGPPVPRLKPRARVGESVSILEPSLFTATQLDMWWQPTATPRKPVLYPARTGLSVAITEPSLFVATTVDQWFQPLQTPQKPLPRPVREGASLAITEPSLFVTPLVSQWHADQVLPLPRPVRQNAQEHVGIVDPSVFTGATLTWWEPSLAPPVRRPATRAGDVAVEPLLPDFFGQWLVEPCSPGPRPVSRLGGWFDMPAQTTPAVDLWLAVLPEPLPRPRRLGTGIVVISPDAFLEHFALCGTASIQPYFDGEPYIASHFDGQGSLGEYFGGHPDIAGYFDGDGKLDKYFKGKGSVESCNC